MVGPLFSASRLSFLIEFSTGVDWIRATMAGLSFSAAASFIDALSSQDDEPFPEVLLGEMRGMAMGSAYAAHRCGIPLAGVMIAEGITSLSLGDRMLFREISATLTSEDGMTALQQQLTRMERGIAREMREIRAMAKRSMPAGLGLYEATTRQFLDDLTTSDSAEDTRKLATSPNGVAAARAVIASGRTLVYIAPSHRSCAALRVNSPENEREICESMELPALDLITVRGMVEQVRDGYAAAQRGELGQKGLARLIRETLDQLASKFWDPLLAEWPDLRETGLALAPLGEAALLPFYTAFVDGTPACAALDLTIVPSGRSLLLSTVWQPSAKRRVLVAADPWFDGDGLRSIPRTVPEAREIAAVHGAEPMLFRTDMSAGEDSVPHGSPPDAPDLLRTTSGSAPEQLAAQKTGPVPSEVADLVAEASLLHLACHGELRSDEPLASALLLGGRLPLSEVLQRNLRPGAAVLLSACELGSISGELPDEQLGFPAALLAVGARSVVGALWPVPDTQATVTLMTDTHRAMLDSDVNRGLGQAIGKAHAGGVPPSVWASFAHFGA
ncbi:CHAT domain-containing protein [Streptomyces sp. cf124]|nr:CHAT domain-containing protein [Streptomyces sp. cf124]